MNWFTENKVFSSVMIVIALAVLALSYLTFNARADYGLAVESYQTSLQKLVGLRGLAPFRSNENLKKIKDQVVSYQGLTADLHNDLVGKQGAIAPMEPAVFQGRLRESVSKIVANAAQRGVELPPAFYLGFDKYEKELPRNDMAGLLNWQLQAIESVVSRLIDLKVAKVINVIRLPLPGETGTVPPVKEEPLLKKYPFEVVFFGYPRDAKAILNDLTATPEFMIARAVRVENEAPKSPLRGQVGSTTTTADGQPATAAPVDKIIFGQEKITTSIIIDLVQFSAKKPLKK